MEQPFLIIIPARMHSTRLPGKALKLIAGKPMIEHVYTRALNSGAEQVIVATDDEQIARVVNDPRVKVCITSSSHQSGTERIAEVVEQLQLSDETIVVNVQGDEPLIPVENIQQTAQLLLADSSAAMSTLCVKIHSNDEWLNPNVVKVVRGGNNQAVYFSRSPVPWKPQALIEAKEDQKGWRHIGIYGYRASFIKQYVSWSSCDIEQQESLEQLRALWYGAKILVEEAKVTPPGGIDTLEDLERVNALLKSRDMPMTTGNTASTKMDESA